MFMGANIYYKLTKYLAKPLKVATITTAMWPPYHSCHGYLERFAENFANV